jgi:hypothetical protein
VPGWTPERRNRKIGTSDWAWRDKPGNRSPFGVPWPRWEHRGPAARWVPEAIEEHEVHGRTVRVVVEEARAGSDHSCTPDDVCCVLRRLPEGDVTGLDLVVLRQPTRKEQAHLRVWGWIYWCVSFRGYTGPAVVLDTVDFDRPRLRWSRSLGPDLQRDLHRLREKGFMVVETRRGYEIMLTREHVRRWQLTHTLPHEVGHWVDFRRRVLDPLGAPTASAAYGDHRYDDLVKRWWQRPEREIEQYADRYADNARRAIGDI